MMSKIVSWPRMATSKSPTCVHPNLVKNLDKTRLFCLFNWTSATIYHQLYIF